MGSLIKELLRPDGRNKPITIAVTTRLWDTGDIVDVLEVWEASNAKQIVSQMPRPENDHMP
jgi:hypothetical protein